MTLPLYLVLGVEESATVSQLKSAYRAASRRTHPDQGGDQNEFHRVTFAWKVLSDPTLRAAYNAGVPEEMLGAPVVVLPPTEEVVLGTGDPDDEGLVQQFEMFTGDLLAYTPPKPGRKGKFARPSSP